MFMSMPQIFVDIVFCERHFNNIPPAEEAQSLSRGAQFFHLRTTQSASSFQYKGKEPTYILIVQSLPPLAILSVYNRLH